MTNEEALNKYHEACELTDEKQFRAVITEIYEGGWLIISDLNGKMPSKIESRFGPRSHIFEGCWEGELNAKQWAGKESIPQSLYDRYFSHYSDAVKPIC